MQYRISNLSILVWLFCPKIVLHFITIVEKEIMLEYRTDILKQLSVYTLLFKNLIDI